MSDGGPRRLPEPGWNQFVAAPPDNAYSYHSEPGTSSYTSSVTSEPTYTVTYYYIEYLTTNVPDNQAFNYAKPNDFVPATASGLKSTQNGPGGLVGDVADLRRTVQHDNHVQLPPPPNYVGKLYDTTLPLNYVLANVVSTTSDSPIASQILSREASTVAALNAVARDIALQEFSSNLFQSNTTTAYDRVNVDTLAQDTTQSEVVDGLIHPTDESTVDVIANSSDAVIHEREAVDAVLEDLHDIDSLLPTTESQDLKFKTDLQTETALDELPAGEVDGGMVLLQSTGDANGNGFDLTQVYAEHVGRFNAPAKMETSVGMFQAVDVGSDEAPIVESVPQNESTTQFNRETKLDDEFPGKREHSSNKAAAVIGATTLTGALVWLNRAGSQSSRQKPTAQKRRVFRA
jgi:hypothetical protein